MTSHTAHIETLVAPTLINIAAKGRPGDARFHDATRAEAVVLNDTVAPPLWRGAASRAETMAAVATQAVATGGFVHNVQRQEFVTISDLAEIIGGNQPPSWGSASGTVFELKQGESLNLADALRFTDADDDPLTITQIAGTLPAGTTFNPVTGFITADEDATLGLHPEDLVFQADDGQQTVLNVGPTKPYKTIRAAVLAAKDFDTIQIDPGDYIGDVSTLIANNVLIKGTSSTNRARLFANGVHQSDKGIIVLEGDDCTFENMDFHDAEGPSGNIAGVRHDGAGLTTFRRCGFFDCENGILSGGGGTVLMEFCEFARCGYGDGTTHNVYFGNHQMVTARDCYFHEAKIGHEFKSRAKENILERCYFVCGPTGTSSYNVNVDNGGKLTMRGCMLHKGPNADNQNMIFHNTNQWGSSFNSILLEHCTLVHDYPSGAFVNLASGTTTVTLTACLFASDGRALVTGTTPVQNSNFHTTVASIPQAENVVDPDFWPSTLIHNDLDIPTAVVPTYLIDEPNIFTPRTLAAPPKVIGAIQNVLQPTSPGGLPVWLTFPTQQDEQDYYDTNFGPNTGKHEVWTYTQATKQTIFNPTPPNILRTGHYIHADTEGDDLWSHYVQYKRTKDTNTATANIYLAWATAWRNFFIDDYVTHMTPTGGSGADAPPSVFGLSCNNYDHLYGQGLVLWGVEQNDVPAKDALLQIAATVEPSTLALGPIGTFRPSDGESRRYGRRLLFLNYVAMMEPIARWIDLRDHMLELWLQSPSWTTTTQGSSLTLAGGTHHAGIGSASIGWANTQYTTQGFRYDHSFMYGLKNEAFWLSYKLTGRPEIAEQLIEMQRYILHYAWDPAHLNPMCGGRWGHRPVSGPGSETNSPRNTPGFLHTFSDEYHDDQSAGGFDAGVVYTDAQLPMVNDPNLTSTDNYESSLVNGLVYAYKLTGETAFLKRAREHFRQATQYTVATGTGKPKQPSNKVNFFMDTQNVSDYFNYNKGMAQYAYKLFENGGLPTLEIL